MKIVSVNVGLPREVVWKGITVQTAIFKEPVAGTVAISKLNLAGDLQADLTVHGGWEKAVYAYPAEHYDYWREQLSGSLLSWGAFGENLTTAGLREDEQCIGDLLRVGSAVLQITQPRMPCYKLELRFNRDDMIKRFLVSGRSGFYLSVIEPGMSRQDPLLRSWTGIPIGSLSVISYAYTLAKHATRNYFSERYTSLHYRRIGKLNYC